MTTHGAPSAQPSSWDNEPKPGAPTVGWFVRRSALWAGIVVVAVISACALYAVASDAGDVRAAPKAEVHPLKV